MLKGIIGRSQTLLQKIQLPKLKWPVKAAVNNNLATIYAGTWLFYDIKQSRHHQLQISPQLAISIDSHPLAGTVTALTPHQLLFLDQYGYELQITAAYERPFEIYDEADHRTYLIQQNNKPR
ncbi:DUF4828 domain-containing protein [Loigolactobacillus zhaoyuanensis]|uniref:DUF4828 domain-containing protein n=1 Tax=Loigolactobacillus zhaoyuanensis TaxID=2486017 RepID=A0ABW8UE47_9LACO|nr:DUF4828 domain-containing protein [Loigolactobacillus zhaoyuanensis]